MEVKNHPNSVNKINGWKLFSYNIISGSIKEKTAQEMVVMMGGREVTKLIFVNDENCICLQANNERMARRKIKEFINHKRNEKKKIENRQVLQN